MSEQFSDFTESNNKDPLKIEHPALNENRGDLWALERAVGGPKAIATFVNTKWDILDEEKKSADATSLQNFEQVKQEINDLIHERDWMWLLGKAWDVVTYFFLISFMR